MVSSSKISLGLSTHFLFSLNFLTIAQHWPAIVNVAQQFNDHRPAIAKTAQRFSKVAQRFSDVVRLADE